MKYVVLIINIIIFVAVLAFALANTNGVDVKLLPQYIIRDIPLIVVILAAFILGVIVALLLSIPKGFRKRRERSRLSSENRNLTKKVEGLQRELVDLRQEAALKKQPAATSKSKSVSTVS